MSLLTSAATRLGLAAAGRVCARRQVGRLARLRPSPAPAPAFREGVNVLLAGTEEIQKVHAHVFAGLADAQKRQIFLHSFRRCESVNDAPQPCERLYCMLGIVVIPRNTIVFKKREQPVSVLFQPLLALDCCLSHEYHLYKNLFLSNETP